MLEHGTKLGGLAWPDDAHLSVGDVIESITVERVCAWADRFGDPMPGAVTTLWAVVRLVDGTRSMHNMAHVASTVLLDKEEAE